MKRIERISAILVTLQSRSVITARQIADQFGISLRTVYRDIRVLEESGIPIYGEAGTGYSLVEGFKLPPLMFTTEEAIAFLMAEKLVCNQTESDSEELYRSGMDKIRAVLKASEKNILENFDKHLHLVEFHNPPRKESTKILQPLLTSILEKKRSKINYYASYNNTVTNREIEPVGIFYMSKSWYLLAWCLLRNDYRTFNLNRIESLTITEDLFTQKHKPLKALMKELYCMQKTYKVRIKLPADIAFFKTNWGRYAHGFCEETSENNYIIQTYLTDSLEYFARWYLSFADSATILEPQELKTIIKDLIGKINLE